MTHLQLIPLGSQILHNITYCGISIVSSKKLLELVMHCEWICLNHMNITFRLEISSLSFFLLNCYDLKLRPTSYGIRGCPNTYNASSKLLSKDNMLPLHKRSYFIVAILRVCRHRQISLKSRAIISWNWLPKSISTYKICYKNAPSSLKIIMK